MSAASDAPPVDAEHPWPGLESYAESARAWFHGRELEAAALLALVEREVLTVLYGRSGLGKTSLLQAGLAPLLREAGYLPVRVHLRLEDGAPDLTRQVAAALECETSASGVEAPAWPPGMSLWEFFHRTDCDFWTADDRLLTPVLIFDQFEEIFTLGRESPECRARCDQLLGELGDLLEDRQPQDFRAKLEAEPGLATRFELRRSAPRVLLSFREDYLADFDILYEYLRARTSNRFRLLPMDGAAAKRAIEVAGGSIVKPSVAEQIVRFIDERGQTLTDLKIEPALLSLVCRELNETRLARGEPEISAALLQGDSARRIIDAFYEQGFQDLDPRVRHFVEDRLLTTAGFRDSSALDNALATPGVTAVALDTLVARRILRREERGGQIRLELIHDVLAGVAKVRRGARREAEALAHAREQLATQRRKQKLVTVGAATLLVILSGVTWLAIEANLSRNDAARQSRIALSRLLAFESQRMLAEGTPQQFTLGTLLAILSDRFATDVYSRTALDGARVRYEVPAAIAASAQDFEGRFALSPDGRTLALAIGTRNGSVRLWNVASRVPLGEPLGGKEGVITSIAFSPNGHTVASVGVIVTGGSAVSALRLWDVASQRPLGEPLSAPLGNFESIAFSPDGLTLASGAVDGAVRLWDVASRRAIGELRGHAVGVPSVAFSPDGLTLASGSIDDTVRLWDVASRRPLGKPLRGHTDNVNSVAFSPDGRTLASGSDDRTVRLWDVASRRPLGEPLRGHEDNVDSVAFSPDGRMLASGSEDRSVRLWDVATGRALGAPLRGHEEAVRVLVFGADGRTLASGSDDHTVRVWDVANRRPLAQPLGAHFEASVNSVAFSPDSRILAIGSGDHTVSLWDLSNRRGPEALRGHDGQVSAVAFSPDGHTLASGSWDSSVRLWDVATGRALGAPLRGHEGVVTSVAFSPDGRMLASGGLDADLRLWDVASRRALGEPLRAYKSVYEAMLTRVSAVAFSPDGRTLASGSSDHMVRLWDVASRRALGAPLQGHEDNVVSVAFSPDGRMLASGSEDHTVRLWDVASRRALGEPLRGHDSIVTSVAFSPDGRILASGSLDKTLRLWDVASHRMVGEPRGHEGSVRSVAFSPDGRTVASGGDSDRGVFLWDVDFKSWAAFLCACVPRNITRAEWREYVGSLQSYVQICPNLPMPPDR